MTLPVVALLAGSLLLLGGSSSYGVARASSADISGGPREYNPLAHPEATVRCDGTVRLTVLTKRCDVPDSNFGTPTPP
eukprot:SAG31_NODE_5169_length_2702_cov_1.711103_1_plen_78_part_00